MVVVAAVQRTVAILLIQDAMAILVVVEIPVVADAVVVAEIDLESKPIS